MFRTLMLLALTLSLKLQAQAPGVPAAAAPAAPAKIEDPLHRDAPQSSVVAFLEAAHAKNYARAWRYLDLRKLPEDRRSKDGPQLAQDLQRVLDNDAQFDVALLSQTPEGDQNDGHPRNRERIDSFNINGKQVDLELERITRRSGNTVWVLSADSVEALPDIAREVTDTPLERFLPTPLVNMQILDTPVWRWIALAILAIALTLISGIVSRVLLAFARPALKRFAPNFDSSVLDMFVGPLRLLFIVAGFRAGMIWAEPSALPRLYLERGLGLLFSLGVAWLLAQLVELVIRHLRHSLGSRFQNLSYSVLPLASRVLKLTILVLAITATLDNWGYNTRTILATLGLGGLAIALAAQKTVEHLFGGVAVISDRPVVVGDVCKFGDQVGTVEDIGLRSTRIRTANRTLVTVPNGQFSSMTLENLSSRDKMLLQFTLNLRRDTTPDQVRTVLNSIANLMKNTRLLETGAMPVRFVGLGTYSLDLEVSAYVTTASDDEFMKIRQDMFLAILDAIEAAGTALALPTVVPAGLKLPINPSAVVS